MGKQFSSAPWRKLSSLPSYLLPEEIRATLTYLETILVILNVNKGGLPVFCSNCVTC